MNYFFPLLISSSLLRWCWNEPNWRKKKGKRKKRENMSYFFPLFSHFFLDGVEMTQIGEQLTSIIQKHFQEVLQLQSVEDFSKKYTETIGK